MVAAPSSDAERGMVHYRGDKLHQHQTLSLINLIKVAAPLIAARSLPLDSRESDSDDTFQAKNLPPKWLAP